MAQRDSSRSAQTEPAGGVRLDKWLWAARFFKTRSLSAEEIGRNRVEVNGQTAKASREVRVGDRIRLRRGDCPAPRDIVVLGLSSVRGPAPVARLLYEETAESLKAQADWTANRRFQVDPARSIEQGRPTKQDRRRLGDLGDWQRWSASIDD